MKKKDNFTITLLSFSIPILPILPQKINFRIAEREEERNRKTISDYFARYYPFNFRIAGENVG